MPKAKRTLEELNQKLLKANSPWTCIEIAVWNKKSLFEGKHPVTGKPYRFESIRNAVLYGGPKYMPKVLKDELREGTCHAYIPKRKYRPRLKEKGLYQQPSQTVFSRVEAYNWKLKKMPSTLKKLMWGQEIPSINRMGTKPALSICYFSSPEEWKFVPYHPYDPVKDKFLKGHYQYYFTTWRSKTEIEDLIQRGFSLYHFWVDHWGVCKSDFLERVEGIPRKHQSNRKRKHTRTKQKMS
jgi:hypothetical protein